MTNEQLFVIVHMWANRIEREIQDLAMSLPSDMIRHTERVYTGTHVFNLLDKNPDNWKDIDGDPVTLDGLKALLDEMRQAEKILIVKVPTE